MSAQDVAVTFIQIVDIFRLIFMMLLGVLNMYLSKMVWELLVTKKAGPYKSTPYVIISLMILCLGSVFEQIGRLGTPMTWRLPLSLLGVGIGLYATIRRSKELDTYYEEKEINEHNTSQ